LSAVEIHLKIHVKIGTCSEDHSPSLGFISAASVSIAVMFHLLISSNVAFLDTDFSTWTWSSERPLGDIWWTRTTHLHWKLSRMSWM